MYCRYCGHETHEENRFCRQCGHEINEQDSIQNRISTEGKDDINHNQYSSAGIKKINLRKKPMPELERVPIKHKVEQQDDNHTQQDPALHVDNVTQDSTALFSILSDFKREFLEHYIKFSGRTSRRAFISYILLQSILFCFILNLADLIVLMLNPIDAYYAGPVIMSLAVILALGIFFLPSLGISIRRLHDIGHSGLEYFLIFLPLANFYMLYLLFTAGDKHVNAYGIPEKFDTSTPEAIIRLQENKDKYRKEAFIAFITTMILSIGIANPVLNMSNFSNRNVKSKSINTSVEKSVTQTTPKTEKPVPPPVDPKVQIANEAKQALLAYHQAISNQDIVRAYNLMTKDRQQLLGGLDSMRRGYSTTISSTIVDAKPSYVSPTKVVFQYKLNAKDAIDGRIKLQTFTGDVTMVNINGKWYMDDMTGDLIGSSYQ